jgi:hypothetical protein
MFMMLPLRFAKPRNAVMGTDVRSLAALSRAAWALCINCVRTVRGGWIPDLDDRGAPGRRSVAAFFWRMMPLRTL